MAKTKEEYKIIFFGTPDFAVPSLKALLGQDYKIMACVTKPDAARGRDLKVTASPVKKMALKHGLTVLQPEIFKEEGFYPAINNLKPDVIIVVAYGKILPQEILNLPPFGCLNIHASLLPLYRGASPLHSALINHNTQTGVTLMKMDEKMDTGPILAQKSLDISENDNLETLHNKLSELGAKLLVETLPLYLAGKIRAKQQNESLATYTKIITKEDGHLDFHLSSLDLMAKIRAYNPWPGTYCFWQGKNLKILEMAVLDKKFSNRPGEIIIENKRILVSSADKLLEIKILQLEGRKALAAKDFLIGYPDIAGAVLD